MSMEICEKNGDLYVSRIEDFHLAQTLECGQCFHFEKVGENDYFLSAKGRFLHIEQKEDSAIKRAICKKDDKLKPAIQMMWGIRILNQDFFETMISFIISQNKQIPHIKKIVSDLSIGYGSLACGAEEEFDKDKKDTELSTAGVKNKGVFYDFPSAKELLGLRNARQAFGLLI